MKQLLLPEVGEVLTLERVEMFSIYNVPTKNTYQA